jgi:hypothetical protein
MVVVHVGCDAWFLSWTLCNALVFGRAFATLLPLSALGLGLFEKSLAISFFLSAFAIFHLILSD